MPTPVLATKLFLPPPRPNAVLRAALIARLNAGIDRKLTLIAAPAGFGKTSLASAWIRSCGRPAAWLSLDPADSDPTRFLAYLLAALQTIAPTVGADLAALLQSPQPPSIDQLLPLLLNAIATLPQPALLVLDDYHLLDTKPIDQILAFLVEHLPPQLHLVLVTRQDPPLPLARLRARGQMTELRAADLRFSATEAAAFLTEVMGLNLSAPDIAALQGRTEGWIAGLQLAALSVQGHQDSGSFIRAFAGNHRYIVDYLVEEVLAHQAEAVRSFLLQTSILERLYGPLCDAVTGQQDGNARLQQLERGNFFVVPLDDRREWYRYHHLFADVLHTHLLVEQPDQVSALHQRASAWYEQHGAPADAIRHALAAQDGARAADLIELAAPALRRNRQETTLLGWLTALPDELISSRPVLNVHYAGALLSVGALAGVEARLRDAERWLETSAPLGERQAERASAMVVRDEATFRQLPGAIAVYRAAHALALDDVAATVTYARQALASLADDEHVMRGAASGLLGLARWTEGDLEAAYRSYSDGMAQLHMAGHIADTINGAITLATIRMAQGRLRDALRTYEQGLQLASEQGTPLLHGAADMHVGISEILRERNDLHAASQHLLGSQEQGEHRGLPQNRYRWRVALAQIRVAEGNLHGALTLLDEAERLYQRDFSPNVRPIAALKTRVWLAQGRLAEALDWAREQGLSADDALSYGREFAHITLARVLLARSTGERADRSLHEAMRLLQRLLAAAEAGQRTGSVIEILLLLALAQQMQGDTSAARVPLSRALALAKPEGYVRLFVDEGPAAQVLIAACRSQITRSATGKSDQQTDKLLRYIDMLLAAFAPSAAAGGDERATNERSPNPTGAFALVEPLSERERDVLRLLRTELDGPAIARTLVISLNTLRTHTKHIYAKLEVNNRRAAVRRAEELELL